MNIKRLFQVSGSIQNFKGLSNNIVSEKKTSLKIWREMTFIATT